MKKFVFAQVLITLSCGFLLHAQEPELAELPPMPEDIALPTPQEEEPPPLDITTPPLPEEAPTTIKEATQITPVSGAETSSFSEDEIGIQGNWRKKKDWLKQAQEKNDSIQEAIANVQSSRKLYHDKFHPIDDKLDDFYRQGGFDKGKINNLFDDISQEIEETKNKTRKLFSQALSKIDDKIKEEAKKIKDRFLDTYAIEEEFKRQKNILEQLKIDMKAIVDLDKSIRDRLQKADEQITAIKTEATRAKMLSEKIWHVIDDKKAKKIFYDLNSMNEKVKTLQQYIKVDLLQDFDTVILTIQNQIKKTTSIIQNLEKEGIIVINRTARLKDTYKTQTVSTEQKKSELEQKETIKQKTDLKKTDLKKTSSEAWYNDMLSPFQTIWGKIKLFFISVYEILFEG